MVASGVPGMPKPTAASQKPNSMMASFGGLSISHTGGLSGAL